ncbi:MAG: hypothetical protein CMH07_08085 [Marinovum sp.]|nr:hypothetical protein [Marinovum sp.]MBQ66859.1 hypothetical protein [Marinovum sp.]|tara:strand:- start:207 stop:461 length:255 start_codon:yes stop_codon:yes gene_type:complete
MLILIARIRESRPKHRLRQIGYDGFLAEGSAPLNWNMAQTSLWVFDTVVQNSPNTSLHMAALQFYLWAMFKEIMRRGFKNHVLL